jgi:hypothetical protein
MEDFALEVHEWLGCRVDFIINIEPSVLSRFKKQLRWNPEYFYSNVSEMNMMYLNVVEND